MGVLGLPGRRLAVRRLPVRRRSILLHRRPGAGVGRDPDRVLAVRQGPLRERRLEGRARMAAAEHALSAVLLYRAHRAPDARGSTGRRPAPARSAAGASVPHARRRRGAGRSLLAAGRAAVRPRSHRRRARARCATRYQPRLTTEITGQFLAHTARTGEALRLAATRRTRIPRTRCGSTRRRSRCSSARRGRRRARRVPAVRPRPRRRVPLARRARARAPRSRSRRPRRSRPAATCSSPRTKGCSGAATTIPARSCRRGAPVTPIGADAHAARLRSSAAAADRGGPRRASVRVPARAVVPPAARRAEGAVGGRLPALRGRGRAARRLRSGTGGAPALFRAYYLCGGVLTVACLGAGSAWLQLPRARATRCSAALVVATVAAAVTVLLAPVDAAALARDRERPPTGERRTRRARVPVGDRAELASARCSSSAARCCRSCAGRRVRANLWIGAARSSSRSRRACRAAATTRSSMSASSWGSR